jgi:hypothetical protein
VKGLKLYDEDFANEIDEKIKPKTPIVKNNVNHTEREIELPLMKNHTGEVDLTSTM